MRRLITTVLIGSALAGCREPDGPGGPGSGPRLYVTSSPSGGRIFVDDRDTGRVTPDTIPGLAGVHTVRVQLDSANVRYEYNARITLFSTDSISTLHGPLAIQCAFATNMSNCYRTLQRYTTAAGVRFATNPLGSVFLYDGQGQGAFWPATTTNSYASGGIPVIAGRFGQAAVALGMYDHVYLAGRPAPTTSTTGTRTTLRQTGWLVPPTDQHLRAATVRGIEIREEIVTDATVADVVLIRLTFRNITADGDYRLIDPFVPAGGVSYTDTYIGLALDPDIGDAGDDWLSYDANLDAVFAYDAQFSELSFASDADRPALVGLRALRAPAGSTVILSGWTNAGGFGDWEAGTAGEQVGLDVLSGRAPYAPDHQNPRIGHLPPAASDVRIAVTAGPLTLAPGEEAEIVLAVAFARPAAGTYVTGNLVSPGDPIDTSRALYLIAAPLRARLIAAEALLN